MTKKNPVVHFEMPYKDGKRVSEFYSKAFEWKMQMMDEKMGKYVLATTTESDEKGPKAPGTINGGFFQQMPGVGTTVVISVDNLEMAMTKVREAGGQVVSEVMDIPGIGKYAAFTDTEGNRVGMLQPVPMSV